MKTRSCRIGSICWSARVGRLELAVFAVEHRVRPGRCASRRTALRAAPAGTAARARRRTSSRCRRRRGRRPSPAAAEEHLGHLLAHADDQPADDRAGDRGEAAEDHHRQRLQRDSDSENCTPSLRAPDHAGDQRRRRRPPTRRSPRCGCSGMPTDCAAWWSSATARSARPVRGLLEEQREREHQQRGDDRGDDDRRIDRGCRPGTRSRGSSPARSAMPSSMRVDVAAPDRLAEAVEEVGDAERRHEQRDGSWFTSGRSTSRSMSQASTTMITTASSDRQPQAASARPGARPASAANSTIAPCAKLNTPEALKISTKPSATSE